MKILLIDDDESILTIFGTALAKDGFQTVTSATGQDGVNKAISEKPDLILSDQILPDISGNNIIVELQNHTETKNIPVIILSNFSQEELVSNAIKSGAIDYVFKYQVEPQDIVKKVREVLKMPTNGVPAS